ncbi:hypothetical protein LCGC14_1490150, partial [marine sediment metagenome]
VPVGVSSIIGSLIEQGHEVELFDTTFYQTEDNPADENRMKSDQVLSVDYEKFGWIVDENDVYEDFREAVEYFIPDLIMLSIVECSYNLGMRLLESIYDLNITNVVGGIFPILNSNIWFSTFTIDSLCISEGENIDVRKILEKEPMFIKTDLVDINNIPFLNFDLYEERRLYKPMHGKFRKTLPIEFSRGCPYECSYCANHALKNHFGKWYRWKSVKRISEEIEHYIKKYQPDLFYFVSESFTSISNKKFDEICEMYSHYRVPFWMNTRPEDLTEYKVKRLEEIGCFRISVGIEHGNDKFRRDILNRHVTNEKIIRGCKYIENSNITYSVNNIVGFPGETEELVWDTINLNKQLNPDSIGAFIFTPFRGTDIYKYCIDNNYLNKDHEIGDLNRESILINNPLSKERIKHYYENFVNYVKG